MTWIRWECEAPNHPMWGQLGSACGIDAERAFAKYNKVCCRFGRHQWDGHADAVSDETLEQWADWTGKRGRFAKAFRKLCVVLPGEIGSKDPAGVVRGWYRQEKLLLRQERDRLKRKPTRGTPAKTPNKPPENPQQTPEGSEGVPAGFVGDNGYGTESTEAVKISDRASAPPVGRLTLAPRDGDQTNAELAGVSAEEYEARRIAMRDALRAAAREQGDTPRLTVVRSESA